MRRGFPNPQEVSWGGRTGASGRGRPRGRPGHLGRAPLPLHRRRGERQVIWWPRWLGEPDPRAEADRGVSPRAKTTWRQGLGTIVLPCWPRNLLPAKSHPPLCILAGLWCGQEQAWGSEEPRAGDVLPAGASRIGLVPPGNGKMSSPLGRHPGATGRWGAGGGSVPRALGPKQVDGCGGAGAGLWSESPHLRAPLLLPACVF